jgi:hypothetical protein
MGHPDFRVGGKIFATLGYPQVGWAMIKLPRGPEISDQGPARDIFSGSRRLGAGATGFSFARHDGPVREALTIAWRAQAPNG